LAGRESPGAASKLRLVGGSVAGHTCTGLSGEVYRLKLCEAYQYNLDHDKSIRIIFIMNLYAAAKFVVLTLSVCTHLVERNALRVNAGL
jgi:hypothetical protein